MTHIDLVVKRADQVEDNPIARGRGRPGQTIDETIKKDLDTKGLAINIIYDRTL